MSESKSEPSLEDVKRLLEEAMDRLVESRGLDSKPFVRPRGVYVKLDSDGRVVPEESP